MTKEWFTASELAGLPGMPSTGRNVRIIAAKKDWRSRTRVGRGGKGYEFHISSLPELTQAALGRAFTAQLVTEIALITEEVSRLKVRIAALVAKLEGATDA